MSGIDEFLNNINSTSVTEAMGLVNQIKEETNKNVVASNADAIEEETPKKRRVVNTKGLANIPDVTDVLNQEEFNEELSKNLQDDYRYSREKIKGMLDTISNAYSEALEQALTSGDPKAISALSTLFKSMVDSSSKLVDLSNKYKERIVDISEDDITGDNKHQGQTNIQQNFYYGKTEDVVGRVARGKSLADRFGSKDGEDD